MPQKEEVLASLNKGTYSQSEVKFLVGSVKQDKRVDFRPCDIKKGDVYRDTVGIKERPIVIIKVINGLSYGLPLTSTQNEMALCPAKSSRFESEEYQNKPTYFCKTMVCQPVDMVKNKFIYVYENRASLNHAIATYKNLINRIL